LSLAASAYRKVAPARLDQRNTARHPVIIKRATVRGHGRQAIEAELTDVSIYGCRVAVDAVYKIGDRLWLRFAGESPVAATTVWIEDGELGCRFDDPLDRARFRALTLDLD
jgi:hypothetical protein